MTLDAIVRWCASIHFCQTAASADGKTILRRRRFGSGFLIVMANLVLAAQRSPIRFLHASAWRRHESDVFARLGQPVSRGRRHELILPRFAGHTLLDCLLDADGSREHKLQAFVLALDALHAIHAIGISHGDAHGGNVLVDRSRGNAHWIDFETSHVPALTSSQRIADDLRALTTSALSHIDDGDLAAGLGMAVAATGRPADAVSLLADAVRRPASTLLERMQGDAEPGVRARFVAALTAGLPPLPLTSSSCPPGSSNM